MGNSNLIDVSLASKVAGYLVQYLASGVLVPVVVLCFAALLFCQIALLGPNMAWLGHVMAWLPASARTVLAGETVKSDNHVDIAALVMRVFWILSLIIMVLEMIARWLRVVIFGKSATSATPASAGLLRGLSRRALVALTLVTLIFAGAFFAVPHARMAAGSSHATMYTVFVILYIVAAGLALAYAALSALAGRLLNGALFSKAQPVALR